MFIVKREQKPWEWAAADPNHTDAETLYLVFAYTSDLLALRVADQAGTLGWPQRKVYRVRESLRRKGWSL